MIQHTHVIVYNKCSNPDSLSCVGSTDTCNELLTVLITLKILRDFNREAHRPLTNRVLDVVRLPDADALRLTAIPREVRWCNALQEAFSLLLDVRGVDGGIWHRRDVHHRRVLLARVMLLDSMDDVLCMRISSTQVQHIAKEMSHTECQKTMSPG